MGFQARHARVKTQLTDIPQIAVGFTLILLPFLPPDKAKPVRFEADPSDFEPPPHPVLKDAGLAFIEMHLCRAIDDRRNDAGRQEGEGSEQADVPFTLGFTLGNPGEGCNAAEPDVVSGLIADSVQGALMMPFTAAKIGAVQGSVIVVVSGRRGAGSWRLGSSVCAEASHVGMRQTSNA